MCLCVCGGCGVGSARHSTHVQALVLSFHHTGPKDCAQANRFRHELLYTLMHIHAQSSIYKLKVSFNLNLKFGEGVNEGISYIQTA